MFYYKKQFVEVTLHMDHIGQITIELVVGFFVLLIAAKLLGKTQISQLTRFDFISN